ncbi:MAG: hypothetical protein HPY85_17075 [Anaerolineae bacterium]|nr:hypothetical protein [Anaerolineae bacterium]
MNLWQKLTNRNTRRAALHTETDATLALGSTLWRQNEREREPHDREELLAQALLAWQVNPLARRIVQLTTQYVVGAGTRPRCAHAASEAFLQACWAHPLNHLDTRLMEWCDELTRSGNLFILVSTDAAGMSYFRAVPASQVERIESAPNDVEQVLRVYPKATAEDPDPAPWVTELCLPLTRTPSFTLSNVEVLSRGDSWVVDDVVIRHYAVNRAVGSAWGESDLNPLLRWIARYANWLEDRARLNRYRNAFLYVVKGRFLSESERNARQRLLNAQPPTPGSILVADENESWEIIAPQLAAADASLDGLSLKKMIATGAGLPLHFLAEPESATRTTAESSGGPTFRHYQQRQRFFLWLVQDLLRLALQRRAAVDRAVDPTAVIEVQGADISARDNLSLSEAAQQAAAAFGPLHDKGLINDEELLRVIYRFAGETGPALTTNGGTQNGS